MAKFDNPDDIKVIVATDCGSTTTKAILIEYHDGEYRLISRGEAPTTVEAPFEDVTMGVLNAVGELEELTGRKLLDEKGRFISPAKNDVGTDVYVSTSSAGGGLQMMVAGVVRTMTAESAERAALGAGAIVMDVIASNDNRLPHQQIERIRQLRPDMILLSGGIDGGTTTHVVEIAELVSAADPKPRLGSGYKLPIIYAGNKDATDPVKAALSDKVDLRTVENIRPVLERENLGPAREEIHELFMEHVMAQAPGYKKLMSWTDAPIMPTPGAVGLIIQTIADQYGIEAVGVDIGGATTDVFSVFRPEEKAVFNRTVSANLGMSYSISNVFAEATLPMVMRWVPFHMNERDLRNRVKNKMIRPTTIPQSMEELIFEQAVAKEALRLAFIQHKSFASVLKGVQQQRTIADAFEQSASGATIVNMMTLDMLIGSGGVLSHAPRRQQSAFMMIDAFMPEGITRLAVDSIFMMPQLGVLTEVQPKAATEVFEKDCLIHLGTCIAPSGMPKKGGGPVMRYTIELPDGTVTGTLNHLDMKLFKLGIGEDGLPLKARAVFEPERHYDVGAGKGNRVEKEIHGGVVGIILDGRGRPFDLSSLSDDDRVTYLTKWIKELNIYPEGDWGEKEA